MWSRLYGSDNAIRKCQIYSDAYQNTLIVIVDLPVDEIPNHVKLIELKSNIQRLK